MDTDGSETVTLSRKELYEKIWQTPTTKLAKAFGLSDVALGKICKKHLIPKPPLGYWPSLRTGSVLHRCLYQTCVNILDETLEIELREILTRKEKQFTAAQLREREKSYWLQDRKEYEFFPSGNFALNILTYCGVGVRKLWSDGKRQRLENCLGSVIVGLRAAAEGVRAVRLERERWERERQENERRRLEEHERRRKEEEKIKHLEQVVANWNQSQKIREFVSNVERAIAEAKEMDNKPPDLSEWLAWAYRYADSIDPIHLTFFAGHHLDNDTES